MLWRVRGKSQYGLVKKCWHKAVLPLAWGLVASGALAGAGSYFGSKVDKGNRFRNYQLPDFYEDPYYSKSQESLYPLGRDILAGDIPDYYKPIGEIGGEIFEDVLGLGIKDITTAGIESAARLNKRGGNVAPAIAGKVGEFTKKARFDDMMRALQGRQFLLGAGADIMGGVRSGALTEQQQRNTYNISKGNLELGMAGLGIEADAAKGKAIGSGIAGLGNILSSFQLGNVKANTGTDVSSVYDTGSYLPNDYKAYNDYLDQGMYFGNWGTQQATL